jgi:molecular chaperone GrpE (heat shock protein)
MPASSKKQAVAARIALAAKKGKLPKSKVKGASKQMLKGMSAKELKKYTHVGESFDEAVNLVLRKLHFS